jgi:hypothetical protein
MTEPNFTPLLVTGCYRSGTTVLEKVLNMHSAITLASQPFPVLYFLSKERFNRSIALTRRYPLDHLFLEDAYSAEEFEDFLGRDILDSQALQEFRKRMNAYSNGLWTPRILDLLGDLMPGNFFDLYTQLNQLIAILLQGQGSRFVGGKEVLVEEFARPLVNFGARVIFVVRDPRAMIASLNFRDRDNLTGEPRPVLYSLRAWRKSVALALTASKLGNAILIRYEDLVMHNASVLQDLTNFLAIDPYPERAFASGIIDQQGKPWRGNSSFFDQSGISSNSLETYHQRLPKEVQSYIEVLCAPEMKLMNYETSNLTPRREFTLENFRDPFSQIHPNFKSNYSYESARLATERQRLKYLSDGISDPREQIRWFITTEAYSALRNFYL